MLYTVWYRFHIEGCFYEIPYRYFQAFEQYDSVEDSNALLALKYMLMSKIMLNLPDEVRPKILFIAFESTYKNHVHPWISVSDPYSFNPNPDPAF